MSDIERTVQLPREVSGQNILNALRRAVSAPKTANFKFEQRAGRGSSAFQSLERRPTSAFRRRTSMPKFRWHPLPKVYLVVRDGENILVPEKKYSGAITLTLHNFGDRAVGDEMGAFEAVVEQLPKLLPS